MSKNTNKERVVAWIRPDTIKTMESMLEINNFRNKSEFICHATEFYIGYLNSTNNTDYLNKILMSAIEASLKLTENRMANSLFRLTVEMSMMMRILAEGLEVTDESLRNLRSQCINDVKRTRGRMNFEDIISESY